MGSAADRASRRPWSPFAQRLAVRLAQEYSPRIRVDALAPGLFPTEQNRFPPTERQVEAECKP